MQELDVGSSPALPLPFKVVTLTKPPERMGQRAPLSSPSHETVTAQQRAECPAPCERQQPVGWRPVAEMVVFLASLAAAPL